MEINNAIQMIERCQLGKSGREWSLVVEVFSPGSVGGTPCAKVKAINPGIDWDAGKIIINTETPLTALTPDQVEAISKSEGEGNSWHAYEREKKHKARLDAVTAQRDECFALMSDLAAVMYAAVHAGKLNEADRFKIGETGNEGALADLLDRAEAMLAKATT